jgi:hypothetical protein
MSPGISETSSSPIITTPAIAAGTIVIPTGLGPGNRPTRREMPQTITASR